MNMTGTTAQVEAKAQAPNATPTMATVAVTTPPIPKYTAVATMAAPPVREPEGIGRPAFPAAPSSPSRGPGFEVIFAIAGLLVIKYIIQRRPK